MVVFSGGPWYNKTVSVQKKHLLGGVSADMNENKEYVTHPEDMGAIHISEDVLAAIAASAAREVDGVAGLMAGPGGKKLGSRGVRISIADERAVVDVYLMVRYGQPIPEVAEKVQNAVYSAVGAMAGLDVQEVNVHVGGVSFE